MEDDFADEFKEEEGVSNFAASHTAALDSSSCMAAERGLYTVEAQLVPDGGNEEEDMMMVAEVQGVTMKWYQRHLNRWIMAFSLVGAAVLVMVVLVVRLPSSTTGTSSLPPPTIPTMTSLPPSTPTTISKTPVGIACKFLAMTNVTKCQAKVTFRDITTGSTIPSEIGALTQLMTLDLFGNSLVSSIPSEIGLLTHLSHLGFTGTALNSTIPSEIGFLTLLTELHFTGNALTSTISREIGLLTQLLRLDFSNNVLTSSIPTAIGLLTKLTWLSLSRNALTFYNSNRDRPIVAVGVFVFAQQFVDILDSNRDRTL